MKAFSEEIYSYFNSLIEFTTVMEDRIFPLTAKENTSFPFSIYRIEQQAGKTKDADAFSVSLFAYFNPEKYEDAVEFNDVIREKLDESLYEYQDSSIDYIEDNQSIILIITFNKG